MIKIILISIFYNITLINVILGFNRNLSRSNLKKKERKFVKINKIFNLRIRILIIFN